jgi:hypothetical protein
MDINRLYKIAGIMGEEHRHLSRAEIKILLGYWPDRI